MPTYTCHTCSCSSSNFYNIMYKYHPRWEFKTVDSVFFFVRPFTCSLIKDGGVIIINLMNSLSVACQPVKKLPRTRIIRLYVSPFFKYHDDVFSFRLINVLLYLIVKKKCNLYKSIVYYLTSKEWLFFGTNFECIPPWI